MARLREQIDQISNVKKEDRVIITGMTNSIIMPTDQTQKVAWARAMVVEVLKKLDQEPKEGGRMFLSRLDTMTAE